jgi:hypothetical protein
MEVNALALRPCGMGEHVNGCLAGTRVREVVVDVDRVVAAIGQRKVSATSGQRIAACSIIVRAMYITVRIERSATPFW